MFAPGMPRTHARHRPRQVDEVAAVERQRLDLLFLDGRAELGRRHLHERRGGGDRHGLGDRADLEPRVDTNLRVDRQLDVGERRRLEAGQLRHDLTAAGRQRRCGEFARVVGDDGAHQAGALVRERHRGAGDGRTRRIGDGSQDGAGHCLGREADRQQTQRNDETQLRLSSLSSSMRRQSGARTLPAVPMSSTAPRSIEIARAVATTAAATSLPTRSRGSRSDRRRDAHRGDDVAVMVPDRRGQTPHPFFPLLIVNPVTAFADDRGAPSAAAAPR